jgi:hypothetical protein
MRLGRPITVTFDTTTLTLHGSVSEATALLPHPASESGKSASDAFLSHSITSQAMDIEICVLLRTLGSRLL